MTASKIKDRISECITLFGFEFNGKEGNVDPYYNPKSKSSEYLLFFDGNEKTVYSIEDAMSKPFIDGHSLNDIADKIIVTEF